MDDTISRRAAIDAFKKELTVGESKGNYVTICSAVGYEGAKHILESLPSAQRWIPVTEKLPEEKDAGILKTLGIEKGSEYVLATVEGKGERMTVAACTCGGKWYWDEKYVFPDFKVIAWIPFPEPWRGEEHETD